MKTPAYQTIKNTILANIHAGVWQAGQAIPTEHALCDSFGVSRMTVNRALKELADEYVLERRQGSGTFVAQKQFHHTFVEVRNIAYDIIANGQAYHATVLDKKIINHQDLGKLKTVFDIPTDVYFVAIVHYADNVPLQLEERWVSAKLVPDFIHQDFENINTSQYLIDTVPLERGHYRIFASNADKHVAAALDIKPKDAILVLERTTLSKGCVVTLVKMSHVGGRYEFSGTL
ncbi:UTRA domain-containing protein [Moraxella haemolytica]|uniref:UTRA domain-containing protein n=1 Tax=Moraxella haemolytica TaxID=2904119 RepID=UPI002542E2D1|nr:UTRA domain-containing protein [Moraxella sp. ZY171148]WII95246.1 UTRA domain-containing protein [Moraxella sp. ZY171148]